MREQITGWKMQKYIASRMESRTNIIQRYTDTALSYSLKLSLDFSVNKE